MQHRNQHPSSTCRGTILPLLAVTCFALFGFIALAVDLGMLMVARSECQDAADAAALIGARTLDNNYPSGTTPTSYDNERPLAITAATNSVKSNYLLNTKFAFSDSTVDKVEIGIYDYNATYTVFAPTFPAVGADPTQKINSRPWTAARVTVKGDQPTYFARIFGITTMPMSATATAAHRPRDIAIVLDFSGSMQFGSSPMYPSGDGNSTGVTLGLLNPDPRYPQFGHFQRYDGRQTTNPNGSTPHPFQMTNGYIMSSQEYLSPNNLTYDSTSGPPMVNDFYYYPTSGVAVSDPTLLKPAFNSTLTGGNTTIQICPTDANYAQQNIAVGTFLGDRSPRKGGYRSAANVSWDPTTSTGAATSVRDLLWANGNYPATPAERAIPGARPAITRSDASPTLPNGTNNNGRTEGSTSWDSYYDDGWERNGYDLDIPTYISSNYATVTLRTTEPFTGTTVGPGYWGKSFFTWPPDPRFDATANLTSPASGTTQGATPAFDTSGKPMCDWRRRFFLKTNGSAFNPQVESVNSILLNGTAGGHVLNVTTPTNANSTTTGFKVNYPAVLAWIKSGSQTCPPNLRAGRILYYSAIPNDCTTPANNNERFWREYIDFVLGVTVNRTWYNPTYCLAGVESGSWGSFVLRTATAYTPTTAKSGYPNPEPYMCYRDTPNMPKAHFWFGPYTLECFMNTRPFNNGSNNWNWNAGTVREAQCWQLKAGIQSGIDDVRRNHPNDQMGMSFFAYSNFRTPRVAMSQNWDRLKAALFFPSDVNSGDGQFLTDVLNNAVRESVPYTTSMGAALAGNIPNANGGTDPNNGLALAYNMFTPASSGTLGAGGRTGAAKIVIFETDGVPNSYQNWDFVSAGVNSKYNWIDAGASPGNGDATCMSEATSIVSQIAASTTAGNPGFSLPNSPARVYPIAFGDMFTSNSTFKPTALSFLQTIAYNGNTLASATTTLPAEQIITGDYTTRITNMRSCLERIFQSGVQVALIE